MKYSLSAALNMGIAWLGGFGIALLASIGGMLDRYTSVEATLLIAAAVAAVALLIFAVLLWMDRVEKRHTRTANSSALNRDVARLQRTVPSATPGRRHRTYDRGDEFRSTNDAISNRARLAAERDLKHGTTTLNPFQSGTRGHILWYTTYESRMLGDGAEYPAVEACR